MFIMEFDRLIQNGTFQISILLIDGFFYFVPTQFYFLSKMFLEPKYRNLISVGSAMALAIVLFLFLFKGLWWILDQFSEKDTFKDRIRKFEKWILIFGYSATVILSILVQIAIWSVNYDFELGHLFGCFYHIPVVFILFLFIALPTYKYDYYFTKDQIMAIWGIALVPTLTMVVINGRTVFYVHLYFNVIVAVFSVAIRSVNIGQSKILEAAKVSTFPGDA